MKEKCKHNCFPVTGEYIFEDIRSKFQNRHVDFKLVTDGTRTDFVQFTHIYKSCWLRSMNTIDTSPIVFIKDTSNRRNNVPGFEGDVFLKPFEMHSACTKQIFAPSVTTYFSLLTRPTRSRARTYFFDPFQIILHSFL